MGSVLFYRRRLPHFHVDGATYFVTWRTLCGEPDLAPPERDIVFGALRHFDRVRYELHAAVVMNDHVHVIVAPTNGVELLAILRSWKGYSARTLQRQGTRRGGVWQPESFDRVVRSEDELVEAMRYVVHNPRKRWPDVAEYPWVLCRGLREGQAAVI